MFNNWKKSNACRFWHSYALTWYEVRCLQKLFRGSNFVQKFGPSYKKRRQNGNTNHTSNVDFKNFVAIRNCVIVQSNIYMSDYRHRSITNQKAKKDNLGLKINFLLPINNSFYNNKFNSTIFAFFNNNIFNNKHLS